MNPHVNYVAVLADIDADQLAGRITAQQAGIQRLGAWHDMNAELDQLKAEQAAALVVVEDEIAAQAELIAQDDALNEVLDTESTVCFNGDMDTNTNNTPTLTRQNDDLELALDLWEDGHADLDHEILTVIEDSDGERVGNLDAWAKYLGFEMVEEDHNTTWWVKFTSEERTATALTHFLHGNSTATWTHNPSGTTLAAIDWRLQ